MKRQQIPRQAVNPPLLSAKQVGETWRKEAGTSQMGDACCEFHQLADDSTSGCETPKRPSASRGLKSAPTCNWAGKGGKIHGRSIVGINSA